jgi:hypothetical protein
MADAWNRRSGGDPFVQLSSSAFCCDKNVTFLRDVETRSLRSQSHKLSLLLLTMLLLFLLLSPNFSIQINRGQHAVRYFGKSSNFLQK